MWLVVFVLVLHSCNSPVGAFFVPQGQQCSSSSWDKAYNNRKTTPLVVTIQINSQSSLTRCNGKLWQRLEIEEDVEPMWYVLNCIVTQELDLLRQCRERCGQMKDVVKFVVPIERTTRSHGANRMVTDTKVGYPGYVFAKLRLCEEVYEAIQELDLCRSWMGTVNKKGYRKLPPSPLALNEMEIEKFRLEELAEDVDFEDDPSAGLMNDEGIILDTAENEERAKRKGAKIDLEQLRAYMDLRPDDMVKVIGKGKFKGEDGIVKRLKNGKLMIRFFTYGSTYDEWLDPEDVRKLTEEEVLRGLGGPSTPVTQRDLEGEMDDAGNPRDRRFSSERTGGLRSSLMDNVKGNRGPRNTRFERTMRGDQYKRDVFGRSDDERRIEERNWSKEQGRLDPGHTRRSATSGDPRNQRNFKDNPMVDMESQWGRYSQNADRRDRARSPQREERRVFSDNRSRNPRDNEIKLVQSALDGDDWSAFVGPSASSNKKENNQDDDTFFTSLMSELNGQQAKSSASKSTDDDFFSTLLAELNHGEEKRAEDQSQKMNLPSSFDDNDFFASLEAELRDPSMSTGQDLNVTPDRTVSQTKLKKQPVFDKTDTGDDFFDSLEKELSRDSFDMNTAMKSTADQEDFFVQLENDLTAPKGPRTRAENNAKATPIVSSESTGLNGESLAKNTVPVLKKMLKERGLKVSGSKAELIERLLK